MDTLIFESGIFLNDRLFVAHCSGINDESTVHYFSAGFFKPTT